MIYYSSVLIALIKYCVNFMEVNTICCRFVAEPCNVGTVPLDSTNDGKMHKMGSQ